MDASAQYSWDYIAPNEEVSLFLHGLGEGFTAFSIEISPTFEQGVVDHIKAAQGTMRDDEFYRHVDGTMARKIYVHNTGANPCAATLWFLEAP